VDAYNIVEPDMVPVSLPVGSLPYLLNGVNQRTASYDYVQALEPARNSMKNILLNWNTGPLRPRCRPCDGFAGL
jgi:hypothetical protein